MVEGEKYVTEIHIRKVRNQEFGGEPTKFNDPIRVRYRIDRTGFDLENMTKTQDYRNISFGEPIYTQNEGNPF